MKFKLELIFLVIALGTALSESVLAQGSGGRMPSGENRDRREKIWITRGQNQIKSIRVNNDVLENTGNRLNEAQVTITFKKPVQSVAGTGPQQIRVSAPSMDPLNIDPTVLKPFDNVATGTRDAKVLKAEISAQNPNQVRLAVEGKIPKGTKIEIMANVITLQNGVKLPRLQLATAQGFSVAAASADNGPFRATNLNIVTRQAYPNAPPNDHFVTTPPFVPKNRVLDSLRYVAQRGRFNFSEAGKFLKALGEPASTVDQLVRSKDVGGIVNRAWENPKMKFSFVDDNLRAGAISFIDVEELGGVLRAYTLGQNETGQPLRVEFDTPDNPIGGVARSFISSQGKTVINHLFGGEDPRALFCVASHEAGHQDFENNSQWEERALRTMETVCWEIGTNRDARLFARSSEMTPLVRAMNDRGIAFQHSGKKGVPGFFEADQIGSALSIVFRGGNEATGSFGEYLDQTIGGAPLPAAATPTNKAVDDFLRAWSNMPANTTLPDGFPKQFSPGWVDWLERNNKTFTGEDRMLAFSKYDLTGDP